MIVIQSAYKRAISLSYCYRQQTIRNKSRRFFMSEVIQNAVKSMSGTRTGEDWEQVWTKNGDDGKYGELQPGQRFDAGRCSPMLSSVLQNRSIGGVACEVESKKILVPGVSQSFVRALNLRRICSIEM